MRTHLHISIGPVQGFVAQSRRTRDLWGSSYLLSFLSGHAMIGAQEAGGKIAQPAVEKDPLFCWARGERNGDAPRIGSLPNHFVVEINGNGRHVAGGAIAAFETAWRNVCDTVWKRFIEHASATGEGTREVWQRQIGGFWEVFWVAGPLNAQGFLARRKWWRTHWMPDEPGDKCTVMHDFQELSGFVRATHRRQQDKFWESVRSRLGPLDMRDDERLCAIALVKRLFPKLAKEALGWEVHTEHWPSTVYVGAVPWIRRVIASASEEARGIAQTVCGNAPGDAIAERCPVFEGLDDFGAGDFPRLDANYFHRGFVRDPRLCPLKDDTPIGARKALLSLLDEIAEKRDGQGLLGRPPTFYALLLADGDRLGELVSTFGGPVVGRALASFTEAAPGIVRKHDGVIVYAGGDDVLAMLPVPEALACARALSGTYRQAFMSVDRNVEATLSASVVLAHVRSSLGTVLHEAHRLLDDVAKEINGRDSLAVGVLKRGGLHCQWVTTWERAVHGHSKKVEDSIELIGKLVGHIAEQSTEAGLSSALLYRLRETLGLLCDWPRWEPGAWGNLIEGLDGLPFLRAEIIRTVGQEDGAPAAERADELARLLWSLLLSSQRNASESYPNAVRVGIDALILARFLASGGQEEENE